MEAFVQYLIIRIAENEGRGEGKASIWVPGFPVHFPIRCLPPKRRLGLANGKSLLICFSSSIYSHPKNETQLLYFFVVWGNR